MKFISRSKIRKIIFMSLLLCSVVILYVKTVSLAQDSSNLVKKVNIQENTSYTLDFHYYIHDLNLENLISIRAIDVNGQEITYEPIIDQLDKQLIFNFNNWNSDISMTELTILVDLKQESYASTQGNIIKFSKVNEPATLEANFYVDNGLVGLNWEEKSDFTYEIYALQQLQEKIKDLPKDAILVTETTENHVMLSDAHQLNKNLYASYFVVAKEKEKIVAISQPLLTSTLVNRVPITIIESLPSEITSIEQFPSFITVEMFGGIITELPVYYEQLENDTIMYSIVNTPIRNKIIPINPSVLEEVKEEFIYRQMMYPTYYSDDKNSLIIQEHMVTVEKMSKGDAKVINMNHLLFSPTKSVEQDYLISMLKEGNSVIDVSGFPRLLDVDYLKKSLSSLAQKEAFFYAINYVGLDAHSKELYIVFDDEVEDREVIKQRVLMATNQLDGSLESIYEFLVTDYIFSNQSTKLSAYAFLMLAEQFQYDVSVIKVTEHGATTYWNKVIIDEEIYYIDVSKNMMTTGVDKDIFMIKPTELIQYGVQPY